jgi:hypothetical protein
LVAFAVATQEDLEQNGSDSSIRTGLILATFVVKFDPATGPGEFEATRGRPRAREAESRGREAGVVAGHEECGRFNGRID